MKLGFKILIIIALSAISSMAFAENNVSFTASAPNAIANGQSFQLIYSVNANAKDLRLPDIDGFEIIAGPFTATGSSVSYVNGKMSQETTTRFTYTLLAEKEGEFTIPSATITVGKEKYKSNALKVKVLPADKEPAASDNGASAQSPTQAITADNLFLKAVVSKTRALEHEALTVTYKLYSRLDLLDIQNVKLPDMKGFFVQDIDLPQNQQMQLENYNGRNYNTYILKQYLVYPQKSGMIEIEPMSCDVVVRLRQERKVRNFFDSYFDTYNDVKKPLRTNNLVIQVESLPLPKPNDFKGAVGDFKISSKISASELNANEPLTFTLTITGSGNMKMIKTPELKFPQDFETYEPKVTNDFSTSLKGISGKKTIEYLVIPRHDGEFSIPGIMFSYYDIDSRSYKTISTPSYDVKVNRAAGTAVADNNAVVYSNQEQVRLLASDIRYIDTAPLKLKRSNPYFVGSAQFWLAYILPFLISAALVYFFRKQAKESADAALMRNKKANKVARKRLKVADAECKLGNKEKFYDEILKALWGYLCDKLSMPIAELNKENVSSELSGHSVPLDIVDTFIELLNECEFERYAPLSNSKDAMDRVYNKTVSMISTLEDYIKK